MTPLTNEFKMNRRPSPIPRDGFFGRESETAEVLELLARPDISCLTILGPGGVGKTRLAMQIAHALSIQPVEPFPEGIWFVQLASINDPTLVPGQIAEVLDLELSDESPVESLISFLRERESLLILDNIEQVIEIADLVSRIASECQDVKIVATSRRSLRISGEQEYTLAPLPIPQNDSDLATSPAVALFIQRAHMVNPMITFDARTVETVGEICRRLDGLPLAIELAASRVKALAPSALLKQLDNRLRLLTSGPRDAPVRQQTLRSTIGWSYDILAPEERMLFRRLAIFSGGFTLDSAEAIATRTGFDPTGVDVLDVIASLVDHSLIQSMGDESNGSRWTMLETIREFGIEQLRELGELESVQAAHAEVQAALSAGAEYGLYDAEQTTWIRRLSDEQNNIRAALTWAINNGRRDVALRIAGPIWRYWSFRHMGLEGRTWLANVLAIPGDAQPVAFGLALRGAGCLAEDVGDYSSAQRYHEQAREIWEEIGDRPRLSRTIDDLGNVAHDQGEFEAAIALHTEAYDIAKTSGYRRGMTRSLSNLGATSYLQGDLATARERWQATLDSGTIDDPISQAMVLNNIGVACLQLGDLDQATSFLDQALAIHREIGTQSTTADVFINLSDVAIRRGQFEQSRSYFEEAIELYRQADDPKGLHNAHFSLGGIEIDRGNTHEALDAFAESLRFADRANNRLGMADALDQIASFTADFDRVEEAAILAGSARAIRAETKSVPLPNLQQFNETLLARLRKSLGEDRFDASILSGGQIPARQATARALKLAAELTTLKAPVREKRATTELASDPFRLTKREIEVLRLLAEGKTDRDIAGALWISPRTAGTHVANILGKLEVDTRASAVAAAFRHNLLTS